MTGNEALAAYGQYHKALALALAGDFVSAEAILAGDEDGPLHLNRGAIVAHAQIARPDRPRGRRDRADRRGAGRRPARRAAGRPARPAGRRRGGAVRRGRQRPRRRGGGVPHPRRRAQHRRVASASRWCTPGSPSHIRPDLTEARLLAAEILEAQEQFALATAALAGVPENSPWFVTAEIRRANTQRAAGDPDAGIATLTALAAAHGGQLEVQSRARRRAPDGRALPGGGRGLRPGHRADRRRRSRCTGCSTTPAASPTSAPATGTTPRPTSARRWSSSPTSRWC